MLLLCYTPSWSSITVPLVPLPSVIIIYGQRERGTNKGNFYALFVQWGTNSGQLWNSTSSKDTVRPPKPGLPLRFCGISQAVVMTAHSCMRNSSNCFFKYTLHDTKQYTLTTAHKFSIIRVIIGAFYYGSGLWLWQCCLSHKDFYKNFSLQFSIIVITWTQTFHSLVGGAKPQQILWLCSWVTQPEILHRWTRMNGSESIAAQDVRC